jgi:hypothetical protein
MPKPVPRMTMASPALKLLVCWLRASKVEHAGLSF